jgi:hypothetical protein
MEEDATDMKAWNRKSPASTTEMEEVEARILAASIADINRTMVVEIPPTIVHPAVEPKPIVYVVDLSPGETPTNYNISNGIRGDHTSVIDDLGLRIGASIQEIIKAAEKECSFTVPGAENGETQYDYIVECWHRRDRLWVVHTNYRPTERLDSEDNWENYWQPHGGCNQVPGESCAPCLMAAVLAYTEHLDSEDKMKKVESFLDYWLWEHEQLEPLIHQGDVPTEDD